MTSRDGPGAEDAGGEDAGGEAPQAGAGEIEEIGEPGVPAATVSPPAVPPSAGGGHRGLTDEEYAETLYGRRRNVSAWSSLSIGQGWLLGVMLAAGLVLIIVLLVVSGLI